MDGDSAPRRGTKRRSGIAAIVAQGAMAASAFAMQILAARSLGVAGLGEFGLLYGTLIWATGIVSGFIGDSTIVLDRHEPAVRAALQNWLLLISALCAAAFFLVPWLTGFVDFAAALAFGGATFVFLIGVALRSLLMATLMIWRRAAIDITCLLAMVLFLVFAPTVTLTWLFLALMVGQLSAIAVGICLLPARERRLARPLPAQHRAVAAYGLLRGLHQAVQPSLLALMRVTVIAIVGLTAAGELEAARIYTAPAMLALVGLGGFLFANYAISRAQPMHSAVRSADKEALALMLITVVFSICAVAAIPLLGPLITGHGISALTVVGWLVYTLSVAAAAPYSLLAAVRGMQAAVLVVQVASSLLSLALVGAFAYMTRSAEWVPFGLAIGSFAIAPTLRQYIGFSGSQPLGEGGVERGQNDPGTRVLPC
jgi:O-antigen/teichoic acid export membrane protein